MASVPVWAALTLTAVACGGGAEAEPDVGESSAEPLVLDRGPVTEDGIVEEDPEETTEFTLEELVEMDLETFSSPEVSREQHYQLLWHYADLSEDYTDYFAPEEGLDQYNPADVADPDNSPKEILRQHWYAHQLSQLGELIAEEHGGTDTALKLAYVVDSAGVDEMEEQLEEADADPPAFLLESRYDLQDAEECLTPPEGMDTQVPAEEQNCYEIDFEIIQGEANQQAPYFHWTEFETADGEEAGLWSRSPVHWL